MKALNVLVMEHGLHTTELLPIGLNLLVALAHRIIVNYASIIYTNKKLRQNLHLVPKIEESLSTITSLVCF